MQGNRQNSFYYQQQISTNNDKIKCKYKQNSSYQKC